MTGVQTCALPILLADETGNGQLTLDGTDSNSADAGGHVINQDPIEIGRASCRERV